MPDLFAYASYSRFIRDFYAEKKRAGSLYLMVFPGYPGALLRVRPAP